MESLYFLSYDLIKQKDYQKLYDELEIFNAERVLLSVWCFRFASGEIEDLISHFIKFIDSDDRLLIIESNRWAGVNLLADPNDVN